MQLTQNSDAKQQMADSGLYSFCIFLMHAWISNEGNVTFSLWAKSQFFCPNIITDIFFKYVKIIFFYFLKIIFDINILK